LKSDKETSMYLLLGGPIESPFPIPLNVPSH
jgi:hypothetical protein